MRCLIRTITRRRSGVTHDDKYFDGDRLTLGRATDQDIFLADLRVALQHAVITASGKRYAIQALSLSGISVNDHPVQSQQLKPGDVISIANYQISIGEPTREADLVLEVEAVKSAAQESSALAQRSRMTLAAAGLSRRSWSWTFFVVLLAVFLVVPVYSFFNKDLQKTLRDAPVASAASDVSWDSGQVSDPHRFIGNNCNQCHETPFIMVQDHACVSCHKNTLYHADPEARALSELTETRCASCHREHNAPVALTDQEQSLCSDCHADLKSRVADTEFLNASNFGTDHPQFRPTLLSYVAGQTEPAQQRVSLDDNPVEQSNLKFPHDKHLNNKGIARYIKKNADGEVIQEGEPRTLECANCHVPDAGGVAMQPIDMETMCQDCHTLAFDPIVPERKVPHGDAMAVLENVKEFYRTRALEGGYLEADAPAVVRFQRRPGQDSLSQEEVAEAFAWSEKKWQQAAKIMFEETTCRICHEVSKTAEEPPVWQVTPVRVAQIWMPKAQFDHASHEPTDCVDCHKANDSTESSDVLMPNIESCRACHGGEDATNKLPSACVDCHNFHIAKGHVMGKNALLVQDSGLTILGRKLVSLVSELSQSTTQTAVQEGQK